MKKSLNEVQNMTSFPREGVVIPSAARQSEADFGLEGVMAARGSYTVGRLIDLYMKDYRGRDASLHQRLAWWAIQFGDMAIQDIDQDVVAYLIPRVKARVPRVYAGIDADGNRIFKSKGRTVSPATVNRYVAALSAMVGGWWSGSFVEALKDPFKAKTAWLFFSMMMAFACPSVVLRS